MPKKKGVINVKSCMRVKEVILEQNIEKQVFAARIHIHPVTLSNIINGRSRLTEENAAAIIREFPDYRIEWLLGKDDFKTAFEIFDPEIDLIKSIFEGIKHIAKEEGVELSKEELNDYGNEILRHFHYISYAMKQKREKKTELNGDPVILKVKMED